MKFDRCPKAWMRDKAVGAREWLDDAIRFLDHGTMPSAGGADDQPPRFWDAVSIVEDTRLTIHRPSNV